MAQDKNRNKNSERHRPAQRIGRHHRARRRQLFTGRAKAQSAATAQAQSLPARGEFVVRGAHVLSMDAAVGDFPVGDVHVPNGAIVAVAANVAAPGAQVIDGKGMIRMPGLIDTHWHHWTTFLRPALRADDPKEPISRSPRRSARTTRRTTAITASASSPPKRSRPVSPRRITGRITCAARRTPTPR